MLFMVFSVLGGEIKPLRAKFIKWSNTLCLSVFDHFSGLAFKGLKNKCAYLTYLHSLFEVARFFELGKLINRKFRLRVAGGEGHGVIEIV